MGLWASSEAKQEKLVKKCLGGKDSPEWCNKDDFKSLDSLQTGLRKAGLESSNLIVAIDFTKSNEHQGTRTFGGRSLHSIDPEKMNPYEQVLSIMGRALSPFDDDGLIPAFGFGDSVSRHTNVTYLPASGKPCHGIEGVLTEYRRGLQKVDLSGPTSFEAVINKSVEIVESSGNQFHILVIVADGQVSDALGCLERTKEALVRSSHYPLSIVMIGVGDGPWEDMEDFDDGLPEREFDNFQFVSFAEFQEVLQHEKDSEWVEASFAVCALQEVPKQFEAVKKLGLLESERGRLNDMRSPKKRRVDDQGNQA